MSIRPPLSTRALHAGYIALRAPLLRAARRRTEAWIEQELAAFDIRALEPARADAAFLILTFGNAGYLDFLGNWYRHFEPLGIPNYTVVALDAEADERLRAGGLRSHLLTTTSLERPGTFASYGQRDFNRLTAQKILFVYLLLRHGVDVLLTDADTIWVQDPRPALEHASDLQIQVDNHGAFEVDAAVLAHPNVNTGFYYARSNERTIRLFRNVLTLLELYPRFNDQNAMNLALKRGRKQIALLEPGADVTDAEQLSVRLLDPLRFPNGSVFFRESERYAATGAEPIMVHANWIHGRERKIACLEERGWWNPTQLL